MPTERITVKLPAGFDPGRHLTALEKLIADKHGDGWEIDSIDPGAGVAYATRQSAVTEVGAAGHDRNVIEVRLPRGTKPADGDRIATKLAAQYGDGFEMTFFEPFLGVARLSRLDPATARCRGAVAVALGCKPWDVQVRPRPDGGFDLGLPNSYVPSKHDTKLDEVATAVVGREGWYVEADPAKLQASIIPSAPPTFPAAFAYPLGELRSGDWHKVRFGRALPPPGQKVGSEVVIDWRASAFALVAGLPGAGKSVLLNDLIAGQLADGCELVIVDDQAKAVDFLWCKDMVRPGGWGCDSLPAAVAALAMVYEEGQRRARVLAGEGVVNWLELPEKKRFTPVLVVVDEVSALLTPRRIPAGIPKDHPYRIEALEENLLKSAIDRWINKIIAEQRFVGIRLILSSQVANNNTGIGPSVKAKIGHHILQGSNPSRQARTQAFNDEAAVPAVPGNVRADAAAVRGVGVAEMEGTAPVVFKSYFATTSDFRAALTRLKVRATDRPAPTPAEIAKHSPSLEDGAGPVESGRGGGDVRSPLGGKVSAEVLAADNWDVDPATGKRLSGFERANAARHTATEVHNRAASEQSGDDDW